MLKQYPLTYLEAFVAGNTGYYAFTPKIDAAQTYNYQGGIRFVFETVPAGGDPLDLHTVQPAFLSKARELLAIYARGWRRVPILELFLFCASLYLAAPDCRALPAAQKARPRSRRLPPRRALPRRLPPLSCQRLFPLLPAGCGGRNPAAGVGKI